MHGIQPMQCTWEIPRSFHGPNSILFIGGEELTVLPLGKIPNCYAFIWFSCDFFTVWWHFHDTNLCFLKNFLFNNHKGTHKRILLTWLYPLKAFKNVFWVKSSTIGQLCENTTNLSLRSSIGKFASKPIEQVWNMHFKFIYSVNQESL